MFSSQCFVPLITGNVYQAIQRIDMYWVFFKNQILINDVCKFLTPAYWFEFLLIQSCRYMNGFVASIISMYI